MWYKPFPNGWLMTAAITFPPLAPLGTAALEKISVSELICFFQSPVHAFRMPHLRGWKDTLKSSTSRTQLQMRSKHRGNFIGHTNSALCQQHAEPVGGQLGSPLFLDSLLPTQESDDILFFCCWYLKYLGLQSTWTSLVFRFSPQILV